jgi:hypothetical protein
MRAASQDNLRLFKFDMQIAMANEPGQWSEKRTEREAWIGMLAHALSMAAGMEDARTVVDSLMYRPRAVGSGS